MKNKHVKILFLLVLTLSNSLLLQAQAVVNFASGKNTDTASSSCGYLKVNGVFVTGGSVAVGSPLTGSTPYAVVTVDSAGNIANDVNFNYQNGDLTIGSSTPNTSDPTALEVLGSDDGTGLIRVSAVDNNGAFIGYGTQDEPPNWVSGIKYNLGIGLRETYYELYNQEMGGEFLELNPKTGHTQMGDLSGILTGALVDVDINNNEINLVQRNGVNLSNSTPLKTFDNSSNITAAIGQGIAYTQSGDASLSIEIYTADDASDAAVEADNELGSTYWRESQSGTTWNSIFPNYATQSDASADLGDADIWTDSQYGLVHSSGSYADFIPPEMGSTTFASPGVSTSFTVTIASGHSNCVANSATPGVIVTTGCSISGTTMTITCAAAAIGGASITLSYIYQ